jgi:hypothetical protein
VKILKLVGATIGAKLDYGVKPELVHPDIGDLHTASKASHREVGRCSEAHLAGVAGEGVNGCKCRRAASSSCSSSIFQIF